MNGYSAVGNAGVFTTAIGIALSTAGNGGVSVPVQTLGGINRIGVITSAPNNLAKVYETVSRMKPADNAGNEVFGRLTESAGAYTLTYFSLVAGVETAYSMPSGVIDIEFNYRFDFHRLPADAIVSLSSRNVAEDVDGAGSGTERGELLTVTALNTLSNLNFTPLSTLRLIVNGQEYDTFGGSSAAFSLSGLTIIWSATNAGFSIDVTDRVVARYNS